jgi:hypothetical protein
MAFEERARGQAELHRVVTRNRQAADKHFLQARLACRLFGEPLPRPYQLDRMSAAGEASHELAERHRDAVYFRRIRLGYDRNAQRPRSSGERCEVACSVHDAPIMGPHC